MKISSRWVDCCCRQACAGFWKWVPRNLCRALRKRTVVSKGCGSVVSGGHGGDLLLVVVVGQVLEGHQPLLAGAAVACGWQLQVECSVATEADGQRPGLVHCRGALLRTLLVQPWDEPLDALPRACTPSIGMAICVLTLQSGQFRVSRP